MGNHPRVHNLLDLVVGSVRQVRQGPAGVRQHFLVSVADQCCQGRKTLLHHGERRAWILVPAQVGDGPGHVTQEGGRGVWLDQTEKGSDHSVVNDKVSESSSVSRDISQRPNSLQFTIHKIINKRRDWIKLYLFTNVVIVRAE